MSIGEQGPVEVPDPTPTPRATDELPRARARTKLGIYAATALAGLVVAGLGVWAWKANAESFSAEKLTWQGRPPASLMSLEDAKSYCASLVLSGGGWRLPTEEELVSLEFAKQSSFRIASHAGMDACCYWGSGYGDYAWIVDFRYNVPISLPYPGTGGKLGALHRVRCVR